MVEFSQTAAMFMARPVSPQKQIRINMRAVLRGRMWVGEKLSVIWQCALTAQKAKCVLGFINSSVGRRGRKGFCPSALVS